MLMENSIDKILINMDINKSENAEMKIEIIMYAAALIVYEE